MSDLCKVWVVGVFFFFPLFFFRSAREITRVYSAFISLRCFSLRCFSAGFFFFFMEVFQRVFLFKSVTLLA